MLVGIDNDAVLEMLLDRLEHWTDDETAYRLYEIMYQSYIDSGVFDNGHFDVMEIVDNDYVNYCSVIEEGDFSYEGICILYDMQGLGDISCEHDLNGGYSFIEAEYEGSFLVRA